MSNIPPGTPKIYHILHRDNLLSVVEHGCLWSDAQMLRRSILCTAVGMSEIKKARLETCDVGCHPETKVGEYVPFYFCPRSVTLYILDKGNHPNLGYQGGQQPIVHLEADLHQTIAWANRQSRRWAFTNINARTAYANFYNSIDDLDKIDWAAVATNQWSDPRVKEQKQAEFLLYDSFPWSLVQRIGTFDEETVTLIKSHIKKCPHVPPVVVMREWYY